MTSNIWTESECGAHILAQKLGAGGSSLHCVMVNPPLSRPTWSVCRGLVGCGTFIQIVRTDYVIVYVTPMINKNKYVGPPYCRAEMYAGRIACCSWWVGVSMRRDLWRYRQTDGQQTVYITLTARRGQRNNSVKMFASDMPMTDRFRHRSSSIASCPVSRSTQRYTYRP